MTSEKYPSPHDAYWTQRFMEFHHIARFECLVKAPTDPLIECELDSYSAAVVECQHRGVQLPSFAITRETRDLEAWRLGWAECIVLFVDPIPFNQLFLLDGSLLQQYTLLTRFLSWESIHPSKAAYLAKIKERIHYLQSKGHTFNNEDWEGLVERQGEAQVWEPPYPKPEDFKSEATYLKAVAKWSCGERKRV